MLTFDFNGLMDTVIGDVHGVSVCDIEALEKDISAACAHISDIAGNDASRCAVSMEWMRLGYQDETLAADIQRAGEMIAKNFKNVIFLGIGGSYLGMKAAQDAFAAPYHNEFAEARQNAPRIFFEGKNLDPASIKMLRATLDPKETFIVVISKSGETTETRAAFDVMRAWLKDALGEDYGRHIIAITDPEKGSLRAIVNEEHGKDEESFKNFPLLPGVGGRYSEFNMGLLHLAILGIDVASVLKSLRDAEKTFTARDIWKNPAYLYAVLAFILYQKKGKNIGIVMPFSEGLKSTADWYIQLLAESTGKKYERTIKTNDDGSEAWVDNTNSVRNVGRTPIACCGTSDLHSVHQNNTSGENDKMVTFVRVEKRAQEVTVPDTGHFLGGKKFSDLLNLAQEAAQWSLAREQRPSCTITIDELTPEAWAQLLFFFEMATAFEGELLRINAFNQPGVEGYKHFMYYKLGKAGLKQEIIDDIEATTITPDEKFVIKV